MSEWERARADPPGMQTTLPSHRHLLTRLQREWDHLARSPQALSAARRWPITIEHFDSLDNLLQHLGYGQTGGKGRHDDDEALGHVVILARHDQLAARVVLQRLLPGLSSIVRRRSRSFHEGLDQFDELLAAAWTVIRHYPIDRHPSYVAAGLLREIEYHAFRRDHRRQTTFIPTPLDSFERAADLDADDDPRTELRDLLELARRAGVDDHDLELVRRLGQGESTAQLARERHVTDRTIRNHRAAVIRRLREVALAAA